MTALVARPVPEGLAVGWRLGAICAALAALVLARRAAMMGGLDPTGIGLGFGLALLGLAAVAGWRPGRPGRRLGRAALGGGLAGLGLVAVAALGPGAGLRLIGHPSAFWPWVVATVLVAGAEEAVFRGALLEAAGTALGPLAAVAFTAAAFALVHVPAYGPAILPLDFAVGLVLGGLRLLSGGVAAPAIAHALADLATWWL